MDSELSKLFHTINNKLTGINGFGQLLQKEVQKEEHKTQLVLIQTLAMEIFSAVEAYKIESGKTSRYLPKMENLSSIEVRDQSEQRV
jgi:nitrogen-specific signal transduction histidine kinase